MAEILTWAGAIFAAACLLAAFVFSTLERSPQKLLLKAQREVQKRQRVKPPSILL